MENRDAVRAAEVSFITVPFRVQSENLAELGKALEPGRILVDCTVPLAVAAGGKPTRSLGVWQGSAAQQAQEMVPDGVDVVCRVFIPWALPLWWTPTSRWGRTCLYAAITPTTRVAGLIELIPGLRAVDAGPLEIARIVEQLTPMLISITGATGSMPASS